MQYAGTYYLCVYKIDMYLIDNHMVEILVNVYSKVDEKANRKE